MSTLSINANHPPLDSTLKDNEFDFNASASASVSGESLTSSPDKASQKAYLESEKRKAYQKAYAHSEKRKAYRKAYRESDKAKAYQKAYHEVLKNTDDREQAKTAGKQAVALIKESNKAKKSELESIFISPLPTSCLSD
ncbi:hypothetical protein [Endozoicomonas sp. SCSIO W0465]|uniref:hypothetical protein n=1 Tax=Endozoicomonas sp. SCSIO W0465 TaxID=2918516 RepID=UPI002074D9D0|nr:hypothetical protein [Endozoicomonas sp. SCSIO W0465]USE34220.1 hypothetical protein MJO57_18860 [Endozoicomonas sp. SCSIO W0465]